MRILMYGWEFPPHISGGLGVACFGMTQALAELKHDVTFVLPRLKEGMSVNSHVELLGVNQFPLANTRVGMPQATDLGKQLEEITRRVELMEVDSPLSPYLTDQTYIEALSRLESRRDTGTKYGEDTSYRLEVSGDYGPNLVAEIMRYARAAGGIAATVPHDVIHAHDWLTMLAGIEARRISGKPLVVHVHALEFDRSGENVNQVIYEIERLGMTRADVVVAVSRYTRNTIVDRYGVDPSKVEVVHNAVTRAAMPGDPVEHRKNRREKVVLFLGRITFQKGPDYFVEAAAKVLAQRDDVRFVMAGSGDMAPRMIERVAELKLGRKFHFTGFLAGAEVDRMYSESDVYVMPSVSEPFGISPLEAMYHDVPVIISRQSGVSEILKHALKVNFWDVDDLADKILAMLSHGPLRQEMLEQGSREIERIQWSNAATRLTEVYGRIQGSA
ncbi:MAG: glycosyltransferase family 4 protein [Deltaproteobacteria bacterium]|nr:glycosyltransferase family 4 protein [Deltaproteobacteria bacterium]